jgi:HTH-type transcriptional regulator / antitoxin HigA
MMNDIKLDPISFIIQSPPGDTLLEALETRSMSQAELALRTGRPLKTINEIIKGKTAITPETALQLERVLNIPASFWINREQQYRESLARRDEREKLAEGIQWLENIPIQELIEVGWLSPAIDPVNQLEEVLKFFGVSSPSLWSSYWINSYAPLKDSAAYQNDPESVTVWLRKGEIEAQKINTRLFDPRGLRNVFDHFRQLTFQPAQTFYPRLQDLCAQVGIAFCVIQELPNSRLQGVTRWINAEKALIQLSSSRNEDSTFWPAFFHAIGHLLLHGKRDIFIEEGSSSRDDLKEQQASGFAFEQLSQHTGFLETMKELDVVNSNTIENWSERLSISSGVIVGLLQELNLVSGNQFPELKNQYVWPPLDVKTHEEEFPDIEEIPVEPPQAQETQPELHGWPGLTTGAQRVLRAAGFTEEAGSTDERLFTEWAMHNLASVESAFVGGYYRDALMELENFAYVVRIGATRSPSLGVLNESLRFVRDLIETSSRLERTEVDLQLVARQAIQEVYRSAQEKMKSETRKMYSEAATRTESLLADELLNLR